MKNDELFDIVDENNQPTGEQLPRARAHAEGLWHRTVHVYFYRTIEDSVEILVHLRDKRKDLNPNKWDTRFGGHLSAGQTYADAVVSREIEEETGLLLQPTLLIDGPEIKRDKFPNREFTKIYFYQFNGDIDTLHFNDGEVQEVKWMSTEDITNELKTNPDQWSTRLLGFQKIVSQIRQMRN